MPLFTIDRTINFSEEKVKKVLEFLNETSDINVVENKMASSGVITLRENTNGHGFFRRRWSTFLKEFQVYDGQIITEIGRMYLEGRLSTSELLLLLVVRKTADVDGVIVRPFEIIVKVNDELLKRGKSASISSYEFINILSFAKDAKPETIAWIVDQITYLRNGDSRYNATEQTVPCHFDIWRNLINNSGLGSSSDDILLKNDETLIKYISSFYDLIPARTVEYDFNDDFVEYLEAIIGVKWKGKLDTSIFKNHLGIIIQKAITCDYQEEDVDFTMNEITQKYDNAERIEGAENIYLYGVPGSGKSFTIKTKYCDDERYMERIVFHPDYTYSDFVGQILPKSEAGVISYPFVPGPFTRMLKKAYRDPKNKYFLIIEELNRGNAPAIFGEVFQLFDRMGVSDNGKVGESIYGINNSDIALEVYGDSSHPVKIPSNLWILGTMNTADQNVFTLDTAFKRRWIGELIPNNVDQCKHAKKRICGRNVQWAEFAKKINEKIIELGESNLSSEDNRLGGYFVNAAEIENPSIFADKVLLYLWNDAFKFDRDKVFVSEYKTLEQLIIGFKSKFFDVFLKEFNFDNSVYVEETTSNSVETDLPVDEYLFGKDPQIVELYNVLFDMVKEQIPSTSAYTVGSKTYIGFTCDNLTTRNFCDMKLLKDQIVISCHTPTDDTMKALGNVRSSLGHFNHMFEYKLFNQSKLDEAVELIVQSYEQLKKEV